MRLRHKMEQKANSYSYQLAVARCPFPVARCQLATPLSRTLSGVHEIEWLSGCLKSKTFHFAVDGGGGGW